MRKEEENNLSLDPANDQDAWNSNQSPRAEAEFMARLIGRNGQTADSVRADMVLESAEEEFLRQFAEECLEHRAEVLSHIEYRHAVVAEFDILLTAAQPTRQAGCKATRTCPLCGKVFRPMTGKQWTVANRLHNEQTLAHRHLVKAGPMENIAAEVPIFTSPTVDPREGINLPSIAA